MIYTQSPLAIGLFIFFVSFVLGLSFYLARRTSSADSYYAAGGNIHWFTNGVAFAGDYLSAASFLGICGMIATAGYDGWMYSIGYLAGWIVALFLVADAVLAIGQIVFDTTLSTRFETLLDINALMPAFEVALGVLRASAAVGLWFGHRWAWVLAMLTVGFSLVLSMYLYWVGDPSYVRMAISVVIAFYLNQGAVRDYFEGRAEMGMGEDGST